MKKSIILMLSTLVVGCNSQLINNTNTPSSNTNNQHNSQNSHQNTSQILTGEVRTGKSRPDTQGEVSVDINENGNAVVTWIAVEGESLNIYAQRMFNNKAVGDEIKVNNSPIPISNETYSSIIRVILITPDVKVDSEGNFFVYWSADKLYIRKFDKNGNAIGSEFNPKYISELGEYPYFGSQRGENVGLLNKDNSFFIVTSGIPGVVRSQGAGHLFDDNLDSLKENSALPFDPTVGYVTSDKDNNMIFVYWKYENETNLYAQRYTKDIKPIGSEFRLINLGRNYPKKVSLSSDSSGAFIYTGEKQDQQLKWNVYANLYDKENKLLKEVKINEGTAVDSSIGMSFLPISRVSMNTKRDFMVTWGDENLNKNSGQIYARKFDKNGNPIENQFKVNYLSYGNQAKPDIDMNDKGDAIIAWANWNDNDSEFQIYSRQYNFYDKTISDNPALIPPQKTECLPNTSQSVYTGDLKIKVKFNAQSIEIKSSEDLKKLDFNNTAYKHTISFDGRESESFRNDIVLAMKKDGCLDQIVKPYTKYLNTISFGFNYLSVDYNKAPINKIEELLRKYIKSLNADVKEVEFSSPEALAIYSAYLDWKMEYPNLFEYLYFSMEVSFN